MRLKKHKFAIIIGLSLAFSIFGFVHFRKAGNANRQIRQIELTSLGGTLESKPEKRTSKSKVYVQIRLKEYPNFKFHVGSIHYNALSKGFISDFNKEDSIYLDILTYDFERKLQKSKKLNLSEKLINYKFIEVFSIRSKDRSYMELSDVNLQIESNRALGFIFFSIGTFILSVFAVLYYTGFLTRFAIWWTGMQASR